jgi:parallel beta-helix repeat protein
MKTKFYISALLFLALIGSLAMPLQAARAIAYTVDINDPSCNDITGSPYCTIQPAINAASPGANVYVAAGTYNENVVINKYLTLSGVGDTTVIQPPLKPSGTGYGIEIYEEGSGPSASDHTIIKDLRVTGGYSGVQFHGYSTNYPNVTDTISHVTLQNLQCDNNISAGYPTVPGAYYGDEGDAVHFEKYTNYSDILIENLTATDNAGFGIDSGSGVGSINDLTVTGGYFAHNVYPGFEIYYGSNITINGNAVFENNGNGKDTEGEIVLTHFNERGNGNLSITDVTINSSGAETALRVSGNGSPISPAGIITLTNVTINGTQASPSPGNNSWGPYPSAAIVISRYTDVSNVHFDNVNLNSTAPVGLFLGTISNTPAPTLDLSGVAFNGTYGQLITLGRHGNDPSYTKANVNVDARNATFAGMTDNCAIENKITHELDEAELGLVTWVTDNLFVTQLSGSIQRGINAATAGDTINVCPGTYDPQVNITVPGWGGTYPAQGIVVWKDNLTIKAVDPDPANTIISSPLGAWMDWWRIQYLTGGVFTSSTPTLTGGYNPGTSASPNAIMIVKSGVTIDGFTIHAHPSLTGSGYNGSGILIGGVAPGDPNSLGADNNTVKNCVFSDVWQAVYIWHSSGNQVLKNTVAALGNTGHWAGFSIYDGYNTDQINLGHLSKNNIIQGNILADKGISIGAWQPPVATDNSGTKILDNTVYGNIAFYYTASSGMEISGNSVHPGPYSNGQIIFNGDSVSSFTSSSVKNNTVVAGTGNGIQLSKMTGGSVEENTVTGRVANGIALLLANGVTVSGNTATDNGASGIVIAQSSTNITISDNLILRNTGNADNKGGLTIKGGSGSVTVINNTINNNVQYGVWLKSDAVAGNVFHYNNIVNNGSGIIHTGILNDSLLAVNAENNWWGSLKGPYNAVLNTAGTDNGAGDASADTSVDFDPWIAGLKYTGATTFPGPGSVVLQAKLVNSDDNSLPSPVPVVSVEFFANGTSQGVVTTDANGVAEKTASLPAGDNTIRAVITGGGLLGDCLADIEVSASVFGEAPALSLIKSASPAIFSSVGQTINYNYVVKNIGNVSLPGPFSVSDDKLGTISCPTGSLAPNASVTCTASYSIQQADLDTGSITNKATASTTYGGNNVTSNQAQVTISATQNPAITIVKKTNGQDANTTPGVFIPVGGAITWTYNVTNTGNVTLTNVTVTDNKLLPTTIDCGGGSNVIASLAAAVAAGDTIIKVTSVTGFSVAQTITIDTGANLETSVIASVGTAGAGGTGLALTSPLVEAHASGASVVGSNVGSNVIDSLAAGASAECTATGIAVAGAYSNTGTVVGTPPVGGNVTATDPSNYYGVKDLTVSKTATPTFKRTFLWSISKDVDKTFVKQLSGSVVFKYAVNVTETGFSDSAWLVTGKITVTNPNTLVAINAVTITDAISNGGTCSVVGGLNVSIPAGGSKTFNYTCTYTAMPTSYSGINTATTSWEKVADTPLTGSALGTKAFAFNAGTCGNPTVVNKTVTVTDTFNGTKTTLGTVTATTTIPYTSRTFSYSRSIAIPSSCQASTGSCKSYTNTAKIFETGQTASKTVTVCGAIKTGAQTISFWQNKNGQGIIKSGASLNGVCKSGTWLRQFAPFQDLSATASCSQVATYAYNVIKVANTPGSSMNAMLKAQTLATALDVYFSDPALGGNKISAPVPIGGVTIDLTNINKPIGSNTFENASGAFGGASSLTIQAMLTFAASQSDLGGSLWYGNVKATQELAKDAFEAINNQKVFAP